MNKKLFIRNIFIVLALLLFVIFYCHVLSVETACLTTAVSDHAVPEDILPTAACSDR